VLRPLIIDALLKKVSAVNTPIAGFTFSLL
jgi:hypothetical protein